MWGVQNHNFKARSPGRSEQSTPEPHRRTSPSEVGEQREASGYAEASPSHEGSQESPGRLPVTPSRSFWPWGGKESPGSDQRPASSPKLRLIEERPPSGSTRGPPSASSSFANWVFGTGLTPGKVTEEVDHRIRRCALGLDLYEIERQLTFGKVQTLAEYCSTLFGPKPFRSIHDDYGRGFLANDIFRLRVFRGWFSWTQLKRARCAVAVRLLALHARKRQHMAIREWSSISRAARKECQSLAKTSSPSRKPPLSPTISRADKEMDSPPPSKSVTATPGSRQDSTLSASIRAVSDAGTPPLQARTPAGGWGKVSMPTPYEDIEFFYAGEDPVILGRAGRVDELYVDELILISLERIILGGCKHSPPSISTLLHTQDLSLVPASSKFSEKACERSAERSPSPGVSQSPMDVDYSSPAAGASPQQRPSGASPQQGPSSGAASLATSRRSLQSPPTPPSPAISPSSDIELPVAPKHGNSSPGDVGTRRTREDEEKEEQRVMRLAKMMGERLSRRKAAVAGWWKECALRSKKMLMFEVTLHKKMARNRVWTVFNAWGERVSRVRVWEMARLVVAHSKRSNLLSISLMGWMSVVRGRGEAIDGLHETHGQPPLAGSGAWAQVDEIQDSGGATLGPSLSAIHGKAGTHVLETPEYVVTLGNARASSRPPDSLVSPRSVASLTPRASSSPQALRPSERSEVGLTPTAALLVPNFLKSQSASPGGSKAAMDSRGSPASQSLFSVSPTSKSAASHDSTPKCLARSQGRDEAARSQGRDEAARSQGRDEAEELDMIFEGAKRAGGAVAGAVLSPMSVASSVIMTVSSFLPVSSWSKWKQVCAAQGLTADAANDLLNLAGGSYEEAQLLVQKGDIHLSSVHAGLALLSKIRASGRQRAGFAAWLDGVVSSKCDSLREKVAGITQESALDILVECEFNMEAAVYSAQQEAEQVKELLMTALLEQMQMCLDAARLNRKTARWVVGFPPGGQAVVFKAAEESLEANNMDLALAVEEYDTAMKEWCADNLRFWVMAKQTVVWWFRENAVQKRRRLLGSLVARKHMVACLRVSCTEWFKYVIFIKVYDLKIASLQQKLQAQQQEVALVSWLGAVLEAKIEKAARAEEERIRMEEEAEDERMREQEAEERERERIETLARQEEEKERERLEGERKRLEMERDELIRAQRKRQEEEARIERDAEERRRELEQERAENEQQESEKRKWQELSAAKERLEQSLGEVREKELREREERHKLERQWQETQQVLQEEARRKQLMLEKARLEQLLIQRENLRKQIEEKEARVQERVRRDQAAKAAVLAQKEEARRRFLLARQEALARQEEARQRAFAREKARKLALLGREQARLRAMARVAEVRQQEVARQEELREAKKRQIEMAEEQRKARAGILMEATRQLDMKREQTESLKMKELENERLQRRAAVAEALEKAHQLAALAAERKRAAMPASGASPAYTGETGDLELERSPTGSNQLGVMARIQKFITGKTEEESDQFEAGRNQRGLRQDGAMARIQNLMRGKTEKEAEILMKQAGVSSDGQEQMMRKLISQGIILSDRGVSPWGTGIPAHEFEGGLQQASRLEVDSELRMSELDGGGGQTQAQKARALQLQLAQLQARLLAQQRTRRHNTG